MKTRTKVIIITLPLLLLAILIGIGVYKFINDGYLYIGGWESTPEKALDVARSGIDEDRETVKIHLDTLYFDDYSVVFYVSARDTLCCATMIQNDKGKWHYMGSSEESDLDNPTSFIMNGDPVQTIWSLFGFDDSANKVFGWKYSYAPEVLVNGIPTEKKIYKIEIDGKDRSVDYWWCIDQSLVSREDIVLTYAE